MDELKKNGTNPPNDTEPINGELTDELQKKLKELDKESNTVEYSGIFGKIIAAICICFSLFQIYTGIFGTLDAMIQRCIHLSFGLCLVYLLCPTKKEWIKDGKFHWLDVGLAILAMVPPVYILVNYQQLRAGTVTPLDTVIGTLGIVMVIEAARRIVGLPIVIVVLCFLGFGFFGPYMPGPLAHRGLSLQQMVGHLFFTTEGVFGWAYPQHLFFCLSSLVHSWKRQALANSSLILRTPLQAGHPVVRQKLPYFPLLSRAPFPDLPLQTL